MKLLVSMFCALSLAAPHAFASEENDIVTPIFEHEEGAIAEEETYQLYAKPPGGEEFVGAIIGGIWGAIAANIIEKDHRYKGRNVTCFARNGRRKVFRASGNRPRAVQNRAMDKCYRVSNNCRPLGCQVY